MRGFSLGAGDREGRPYAGIWTILLGGVPSRRRDSAQCRRADRGVRPYNDKKGNSVGSTDCHDQFANWSRNDIGFHKKCGADPVRVVREADPYTPFTDKQNSPVRI